MDRFVVLDRELNQRNFDGLDIRLWWIPNTQDTYVTVDDSKQNESYVIPVPSPELAMHVFRHPMSYLVEVENGLSASEN